MNYNVLELLIFIMH